MAFGVVDAENDENWLWFLKLLYDIITQCAPNQLAPLEKLIFLSDRQKRLIDKIHAMFPNNPHDYCMRHLVDNMRKTRFKHKDLHILLWKTARALTMQEFDIAIDELKKANTACYN